MGDVDLDTRRGVLDELRGHWYHRARPFDESLPPIFPRAVPLRPEHVLNARLASDRDDALKLLPRAAVVAEVGTFRGDYARKILDLSGPKHLDIIDRDLTPFQREAFASEMETGLVTLHEGDSSSVLNTFPDEHFDWIYIDGDHRLEGVRRDAEAAARKVKRDGTLVFNDYIFFSYLELEPYGVVQVVNDMCVNGGWEVAYYAFASNMYCDIAIRRAAAGDR